jgi:hypothetical protein
MVTGVRLGVTIKRVGDNRVGDNRVGDTRLREAADANRRSVAWRRNYRFNRE